MYTAEIFTRYINQIKSPEVKNIVKRGLAECPEEFYTMAASTTGKYHPKFALGEGGLIRHTLAAEMVERISKELYDETFNEVYKEKGHYIACLIASHMGQWNVNLYSKTILPKPKTAT